MDDVFLNVVFVIVIIAVFIVRTVLSAKKKKDPPPPQVEIPVHFEDDKAPVFVKDKAPAGTPKKTVKKLPTLESFPLSQPIEIPLSTPTQTNKKTASPSKGEADRAPEENNSPFNLGHLSPLKQAVVMAEILGPPKGLS